MKAVEYYEKYKEDMIAAQLLDSDNATPEQRREVVDRLLESVNKCTREMVDEVATLRVQRNAISNRAIVAIVKEINQKWNKMCRIFVKEYGESPVKENVIRREFEQIIPPRIIEEYW